MAGILFVAGRKQGFLAFRRSKFALLLAVTDKL
jgi:hypothetical protein